ncbi:hypothetical protein HPB49_014453 [Dermacentor silvarum]|uniref:Uncharacterized protein n=1 Tax=Dermacentor silvarum TaxID=543639 RepID=A0ACB8E0V6_DERSI|nr:hypothetical protein HPB49_014453 [Dermacentor silvarum]
MLPEWAKTKQKPVEPEEMCTIADETNDCMAIPGVIRQDQGWCARCLLDHHDGRPKGQGIKECEMHSALEKKHLFPLLQEAVRRSRRRRTKPEEDVSSDPLQQGHVSRDRDRCLRSLKTTSPPAGGSRRPAATVVTQGTDVILVCFSIDSPDSLENIPESGRLEVRHLCPSVPVSRAGTEGLATLSELTKAQNRRQEDYDRLRPLLFPAMDVNLVCFSIDSTDTLDNIPESGRQEVRHFCPSVPVILAGNKNDQRNDRVMLPEWAKTRQKPVEPEEMCTIADETNACMAIPGVIRQDQGWCARCVLDHHDGRPKGQGIKECEMHSAL